jgi:lipoic acid synthetase
MLGFGEREEEVVETLKDLRGAGVQMVTIGQYLMSDIKNRPVTEYIPPQKFSFYGRIARQIGFLEVASGPFVRSSYNARESFLKVSTL